MPRVQKALTHSKRTGLLLNYLEKTMLKFSLFQFFLPYADSHGEFHFEFSLYFSLTSSIILKNLLESFSTYPEVSTRSSNFISK